MIYDDKKNYFQTQRMILPTMNSPSNEKDENNDQNPIPMPLANAVNVVDSHKNDIEALRPASIQTKPVKVPRSQRRGLFGRFTILAEVENPKEYPRSVKWFITFVIAMAAIAAPIGSTLIFRKSMSDLLLQIVPNSSV